MVHTLASRWRVPTVVVCAAALLGAVPAAPAAAQYFGQNKVQYQTFNFRILQTEHFDIYYYPETREAALLAGRMAERWYARFSRLFGHELGSRQPLIIYANHPQFEQTNAIPGEQSEATGGVTEAFKRRIVLPFASGLKDDVVVIGHELVHAFQYDITGQGRSVAQGGIPGIARLPAWFVEGMAEYMSIGPEDPNTAMWMRDQSRRKLPTVAQMGSNPYKWFPYRYGQAFWAYLAGRYGDEIVGRLLETAGRSNDPELAMSRILGATMEELGEAWHKSLRETYAPLDSVTEQPTAYGTEVFGGKDVFNTAPSISPDGKRIAFISTRSQFSYEVYLGDLETGKVIRKLTETAVDPHLESLQFINSAGAWSPDGTEFALAAVSHGRPILSLIDVNTGDEKRVVKLPELGEIFTPSWSPDGRYIAFSALVGGLSDLFMYDLERDELRRLTNDPFGDLDPVWSPDGTRLAFVTDRFTTNLNTLSYGDYRLALIDPVTNAVTEVRAFPTGKHIDPQWTRDGTGLYFVSDRNGIDNIYRIRLADGELRQITNLYSGVTGVTPVSPALSVARDEHSAVMSVFADNNYVLYSIDSTALEGKPVMEPFADVDPAMLPPQHPIDDQLERALADAQTGLPDTAEFATKPYHPSLGLDYVSQPQVLVGVDSWGSYVGGGAALYWSDMLGNRNLVTALQVNGGIKDIMGIVGYTNLRRRLNWGIFAQQIPYLLSFFSGYGFDSTGAYVEQYLRFRQTMRDLTGIVQYPFNRAQRIELSAGVRNITFDEELRTITYDPYSFQKINQTTQSIPTGLGSITTAIADLALVYDQTVFGVTSPLLGQRYRLEVSPSVGSLNYLGVLADYRRYVIPFRPITLAGRIMHYGRYGAGGEDRRLTPIYIGNQYFIRGYSNPSSFQQGRDCVPQGGDNCPLYSRLFGSRIIVANAELRLPLLGALGVGSGYFGALPIDFLLFGDAGLAYWGKEQTNYDFAGDDRAWFFGGSRKPLTSTGAGLRLNLLGFAILELDYAYAFQRKRWVWQFGFTPGF